MTDQSEFTQAQLDRLLDAFNAHDVDTICDAFTENSIFVLASGPDGAGTHFHGPPEIRDGLEGRFATVPDIHWSDAKSWIMGAKGITEWRVTGTLPSGDKLDCLGCDIWEFSDGKVTKKDTYYKQTVS